MNFSLVLARKNSKRLKNKNIKIFCGKPLIYWPINTLVKSKFFNKVFISTDSIKIKNLAEEYGAQNLGLREKKLSNNFTDTITVVKNFITKNKFKKKDILCCAYGSSPFFSIKDLKKAFSLIDKSTDFIFMAKEIQNECLRSFYINNKNNRSIKVTSKKFINYRSQDLPKIFLDTGQFYLASIETWIKAKNIFSKNSKFLIKNNYVDINTLSDFKKAERCFKNLKRVRNV